MATVAGLPAPATTQVLDRPDAAGWVVVDSVVAGSACVAMGGTRMTPTVSEDEVAGLARAMTVKLALVGLPIGGAKAGIRAGVVPDRTELLREFGRGAAALLRDGLYLGCDQGTTHADREVIFAAAGYDPADRPGGSRLTVSWSQFLRHTMDITGFGVASAALHALAMAGEHRPRRVVVQGFGAVGRSVASHLAARGHRVVAVADICGTLEDPRGLPVPALVEITDPAGTVDRGRLPASVRHHAEQRAWLGVDADVLVLAAGAAAVDEQCVPRVRAALVVEGGNMSCTPGARRLLRESGRRLLPDVVVNVGAAAAVGCVLAGVAPSDLPPAALGRWLRRWVAAKVTENCGALLEFAEDPRADPLHELRTLRSRQW